MVTLKKNVHKFSLLVPPGILNEACRILGRRRLRARQIILSLHQAFVRAFVRSLVRSDKIVVFI